MHMAYKNNWCNYDVRPYDPQIGRWHNPDILLETSAYISLYSYCDNDPVNFTDPSGIKKEAPMSADDRMFNNDKQKCTGSR
jgi:RHS repeat-associated protein